MLKNCNHENVYDGICCDCGLCMSSSGMNTDLKSDSKPIYGNGSGGSKIHNNFTKDLKNVAIHDEVKLWVYEQVDMAPKATCRMGSRMVILYAYCYLGYLALGYEDFCPKKLAKQLNMSDSEVRSALKLTAGISSRNLPQNNKQAIIAPRVIIKPIIYLKEYLETLDILNYEEEIREFMDESFSKHQRLYESTANVMCAAFIKYFLDTKNISTTKLSGKLKISPSSITRCYQKIEKLLNKK